MEIRWIVSSSLDYGECFSVDGVFSTEALADAYIAKASSRDMYYYKEPRYTDCPDIEVDE